MLCVRRAWMAAWMASRLRASSAARSAASSRACMQGKEDILCQMVVAVTAWCGRQACKAAHCTTGPKSERRVQHSSTVESAATPAAHLDVSHALLKQQHKVAYGAQQARSVRGRKPSKSVWGESSRRSKKSTPVGWRLCGLHPCQQKCHYSAAALPYAITTSASTAAPDLALLVPQSHSLLSKVLGYGPQLLIHLLL